MCHITCILRVIEYKLLKIRRNYLYSIRNYRGGTKRKLLMINDGIMPIQL
jgi:hypothetical protein